MAGSNRCRGRAVENDHTCNEIYSSTLRPPSPPSFLGSTSLFAVIYCTIFVPYDMSFAPPKGMVMKGIDMAIEMFFITEMIINFFTSYFDDNGEEVCFS